MRHFLNRARKQLHAFRSFIYLDVSRSLPSATCSAPCPVTSGFGLFDDTDDVVFVPECGQARHKKCCAEVTPIHAAIEDSRTDFEPFGLQGCCQLTVSPLSLRHAEPDEKFGLYPPSSQASPLSWCQNELGVERQRPAPSFRHLLRFKFVKGRQRHLRSILTQFFSGCLHVRPNCVEATLNA